MSLIDDIGRKIEQGIERPIADVRVWVSSEIQKADTAVKTELWLEDARTALSRLMMLHPEEPKYKAAFHELT